MQRLASECVISVSRQLFHPRDLLFAECAYRSSIGMWILPSRTFEKHRSLPTEHHQCRTRLTRVQAINSKVHADGDVPVHFCIVQRKRKRFRVTRRSVEDQNPRRWREFCRGRPSEETRLDYKQANCSMATQCMNILRIKRKRKSSARDGILILLVPISMDSKLELGLISCHKRSSVPIVNREG